MTEFHSSFPNVNDDILWIRVTFVELHFPLNSEYFTEMLALLSLTESTGGNILKRILTYFARLKLNFTLSKEALRLPCGVDHPENAALRDSLQDPTSEVRQLIAEAVQTENYTLKVWLCAPDQYQQLNLVLGNVGTFYLTSFSDPGEKFLSEWNDNCFLRRFVRRLRDWGVIDYSCLTECQKRSVALLADDSIYRIVWTTPTTLNNVTHDVEITETPLNSVLKSLKSNELLKQRSFVPFIGQLFKSIATLNLTGRFSRPSEELKLYVTNMIRRGADCDIQPKNDCSSIRKEAMLGSSIYTPMIQDAIGLQFTTLSNAIPLTELNLEMFPSYTSVAFADISWNVRIVANNRKDIVPFVLAEYATEHVPVKQSRYDDDYRMMLGQKDGEKLVASLSSCFLHILDKLKPLSLEEKRQVRIWGVLLFNLSVQFIQMRLCVPNEGAFEKRQIEMLLFADRKWCISLQPTYKMPMDDPIAFLEGILRVWDISREIVKDGLLLNRFLQRVQNYKPPVTFAFKNPPTKMPDSMKPTTTFETPKPQRVLDQNRNSAGNSAGNQIQESAPSYPSSVAQDCDPHFLQSGLLLQNRVIQIVENMGYSLVKFEKRCIHPKKTFQFLVQKSRKNFRDWFVAVKPLSGRAGQQEAQLLNRVQSPHVVTLMASESIVFEQKPWLILIMPRLFDDKYLNLQSVQCNAKAYFQTFLQLMLDAMAGVKALHKSCILHRDLKPPHILRDRSTGKWVIIDLDCSVELLPENHYLTVDDQTIWPFAPGTDGFRAPEVADRQPYGFAADVYSLGKTFAYIYQKCPLKVEMEQLDDSCTLVQSSIQQLLNDMNLENPNQRISLQQARRQCLDHFSLLYLPAVQTNYASATATMPSFETFESSVK